MAIKTTFDELATLAGADLGASDWITVSQDRINTFADATDDHQWIHVDVERAKAGPFGGPIAHGYLTLSLLIPLWSQLLEVEGASMKVNYGLNRLRFPAPVPAGARIRLTGKLAEVEKVGGNGVQVTADLVVEIENGTKPACAAQGLFRFYG
jgi:acyl dehydratase